MGFLSDLGTKIFGDSYTELRPGQPPKTIYTKPNIIQSISSKLFPQKSPQQQAPVPVKPTKLMTSPPPSPPAKVPTPQAQVVPQKPAEILKAPAQAAGDLAFTPEELTRKLTSGFTKLYGPNTPALSYIPQMVHAATTDPFYKANPFLPAAQLIAETSGGANITRPNNPTNWGINYPGNNDIFAKMSPHEVFDRYLTGVSTRDRNYKEFRTGKKLTPEELRAFGAKYAPVDSTYGDRINSQITSFEQQ